MARMHSRDKGKSKSHKPEGRPVGKWFTLKPAEVETLIVKHAKAGKVPSEIGMYLRDQNGIADVKAAIGKTISQVLEEKELLSEIPEDLMALLKKEVLLRKHIEKNKKDEGSKRGLILTMSKTKRLIKYYKNTGRLSADWKYDSKQIALLVE